ncbi:photosystem II cytochrome PsbV2 [Trichocoleus sp. FACHB-262]|uniref:photosystem II cytochrome PsbV2 n=1 Tax=Trichocoleus sp. FACHB-262 TaxID=2692869 RepID=UPI0016830CB4|nr:photosystem II cytochrome PsbV2 [Trichocoleus sp. FACHB-262]MBD2122927.1 photosystem II cytochrome PsbV2 [Trichocoleus sp. FACHB-262]
MRRLRFSVPPLLATLVVWLGMLLFSSPAQAATESYITQYLRVTEPVVVELDGQGQTRWFAPDDFVVGKHLFENNCKNCHLGGTTLPNPPVSLSLAALQGAVPQRDNINNLVDYLRQPMTYDGTEENYVCRQVPESWLPQEQVEKLAAFVLRAAQKAPGWGTSDF